MRVEALTFAVLMYGGNLLAQAPTRYALEPRADIVGQPPADASHHDMSHPVVADSLQSFGHVVGARKLTNGSVVIADDEPGHVLEFDEAGRLVKTIGQRGGGSGDFRHILWLQPCSSDSVHVWDFMASQMSVLSPAGDIARKTSVKLPSTGPIANLTCNREGVFAFQALPDPDPALRRSASDIPRAVSPIWIGHLDTLFGSIDSVATLELVGVRKAWFPRPGGKKTLLAMSPTTLFVATNDSSVVERYSLSGKLQGRWRVSDPAASSLAQDRIAEADDILGGIHSAGLRNDTRTVFEGLKERNPPPFRQLLWDGASVLWVVLPPDGRNATRLQALDEEGRMVASIDYERRLTVLDIGQDYLIGSYRDASGRSHVTTYALRRLK